MVPWKTIFLYQPGVFRFHVSLPGYTVCSVPIPSISMSIRAQVSGSRRTSGGVPPPRLYAAAWCRHFGLPLRVDDGFLGSKHCTGLLLRCCRALLVAVQHRRGASGARRPYPVQSAFVDCDVIQNPGKDGRDLMMQLNNVKHSYTRHEPLIFPFYGHLCTQQPTPALMGRYSMSEQLLCLFLVVRVTWL